MTSLDSKMNVCDVVTAMPKSAYVFEKYDIDYCCGGKIPLEVACSEKGIILESVLKEIEALGEQEDVDVSKMSLSDLVDHIEKSHHKYIREEVPLIDALLEKVVNHHGANHPELAKLQEIFSAMTDELFDHMHKEESVLFPRIKQLDSAIDAPLVGSVQNPISVMEHEHEVAKTFLQEIQKLIEGYSSPGGPCMSLKTLFLKLNDFQLDLHKHVHKENHVLFPKAIKKEEMIGA